CFQFYSGYSF
nr:immunoglobulin light chain junction region [Macaca mulatta]